MSVDRLGIYSRVSRPRFLPSSQNVPCVYLIGEFQAVSCSLGTVSMWRLSNLKVGGLSPGAGVRSL